MKEYIQMAICIGSSLILLPILVLYFNGIPIGNKDRDTTNQIQLAMKQSEDIMDEETLIGIMAKEIPYTYEQEALKAQAVVERTYMARRILGIQNKGAIIGYTKDEMKGLWGEDYERIYYIYQQAAEQTKGELILYNEQPIEAIYHQASSGRTRSAKEVYHVDVPYLKSVDSSMDTISKQVTCTKEQAVQKIKEKYESLAVDIDRLEEQIQIVQKDEADYVMLLQIGNITMTGEEVKELFNLPSCAYKIYGSESKLIFDVRGIGNGVGLSQNGANEMAKQGKDYKQILSHYFTDTQTAQYEFQK